MDPAFRELLKRSTARDDEAVEAIIRLDRPDADVAGVRIVSRFGPIATCRLRKDSIVDARGDENVLSLKAARVLGPEQQASDDVVRDFPLSVVHGDRRRPPNLSLTGAGVVVGFVDWGCDFSHSNFRHPDGSTRLLALWDQRGSGAAMAPSPYGYGVLHSQRQINDALRAPDPFDALGYHPADADRDGSGAHGTHVMDIAVGNGRAGGPIGIAPKADPVFVHLADRQTGGLANLGDSVRILEACSFIASIARAGGHRPWVINLSVGRHGGPHDGCTLAELALDHLLRAAPNRFIVQSAGNYFDRSTHASGHLASGEAQSLTFITDERDLTPNELEVWYSGDDDFTVQIESPSGNEGPRVLLGEEAEVLEDDRVLGRLYHREHDPNNHDNHVELFLYPWAPAGRWRVTLEGTRVRNGVFHAWLERDEACGHCQARFVDTDADSACTTGTIANGRLPLVVGAYNAHSPTRELAPFSSAGPTRDGRAKPDLVAPGVQVLAARSAPLGSRQGADLLTRKSGTSMAAPSVTGAAALCLQAVAHPLAAEDIRELLLTSAEPLASDGRRWSRFGWGYLDIANVVAVASAPNRAITRSRRSIDVSQGPPGTEEMAMETDLERLLPVGVHPERLYREIAYRRGGPLAAWINERYDLLARPGESPTAPPEAGDVLVRVALGEPGLGHVAVLSDFSLTPRNSLDPVQVKAERGGPGLYATVIETGTFPHNRSDRFARRVLDHAGQMPPGQMLLRPKPPLEPHLDLVAPRGDIGFDDSGRNALEAVRGPTSSGGSSPTRTTPAMSSPIATPAMAQEPVDAAIERGLVLGLWVGLLDSPNNHFGDWPPPWFIRTRHKMLASSNEVPLFPDLQPYWPLQLIENASSYDTNMDLYRLSITKFPVVDGAQLDHRALTRRIRLRINDLINTRYASFKPYDEEERIVWESEDPRGAIVSIDALGPDNFDVMCIESYGDEQAAGWVFATMSTDRHGQHPLSGVRSFGIRKAEAGWEFFTQAIDRWHGVSSLEANTIGLGPSIQDYLWQSLLSGVATFVNANSGAASRLPIIRRSFPWARLEGSFSRDRIHLGQARAESLAADRPSEDMEAGTPVEAENFHYGSGPVNDMLATSAHLNGEESGLPVQPAAYPWPFPSSGGGTPALPPTVQQFEDVLKKTLFPKDRLIQKVKIRVLDSQMYFPLIASVGYGAWTRSASEVYAADLGNLGLLPAALDTTIAINAKHEAIHVHQFATNKGPPKTYRQMMVFEQKAYGDLVTWLNSPAGQGIATDMATRDQVRDSFDIYAKAFSAEIARVNKLRPPVREAEFKAFLLGSSPTNTIRRSLRNANLTNDQGDAEPLLPPHNQPADLY
jgi:hypothetical protein